MTLISIIIPTFNSEATISRCLDSIVDQNFADLEVLCMDGRSADDTQRIIEGYTSRFAYIRLYSAKDDGIYDAMNKGIDAASGEWLYFLGSDDHLAGNHVLRSLAPHLSAADVVYGNVNSPVYGTQYDGEFTKEKIMKKNIAHQAIFYRRTLFKKIGRYNTRYRLLADWDLNLRWFNDPAVKRKYVNLTVAFYAPGGQSDTVKDTVFYSDMKGILQKHGYFHVSLSQRIRNRIRRVFGK